MWKKAWIFAFLCLWTAAAGAQELLEAVKSGDLDKVRLIVGRDPSIVSRPDHLRQRARPGADVGRTEDIPDRYGRHGPEGIRGRPVGGGDGPGRPAQGL
jgi:hypothetical protein